MYYDKNNTVQAEYFYVYNAAGQLARQYAVRDGAVTEEYSFSYDSLGRLIRSMELGADGAVRQRTQHLYDTANRLTSQSWTVGNDTFTESYTYDSGDGSLKTVTTATGDKLTYAYDDLKRLSTSTVADADGTTLFYTAQNYTDISSSRTTARPMYYNTRKADGTLLSGNKYEYDAAGNITAIRDSAEGFPLLAAYEYDEQNQLTKQTRYTYNSAGTQSSTEITYTYDTAGNLLTKTDGSTTDTYTYGNANWSDLLTAVNGHTISYVGGNPTNWYNGTGTSFGYLEWAQGRRLTYLEIYGEDQENVFYQYDMEGIRTQKRIGGQLHSYINQNGKVVQESYGTKVLQFIYDNRGAPYAMRYSTDGGDSWRTYYYVLNLQGDVIALLWADGTVCATYSYDAWGRSLGATTTSASAVANLAELNPLRYRGYYYDTETGFYYISSRYYDPEIGRFINEDAAIGQVGNVQSTNMFAYCFNDPVNMSDPTGNWPKLSTILAVVVVAAEAVAAVAVTVATCGVAVSALAFTGSGIIGGISAGAAATGVMIVAGVSTVAAVTLAVAEKTVEKTVKRNNSVYVLKDDTGTVQYVGRTNDVDRRRIAHSANPARAGLEMDIIASGLNLPEARALEQAGMAYYHTINTANKMNNQINSVAPKYWGAFKELALGVLNYGWNQMSNEILYWTGN